MKNKNEIKKQNLDKMKTVEFYLYPQNASAQTIAAINNGHLGGKASGISRRKKGEKAIKEAIDAILLDRENISHKNIAKYANKHINTITKYANFIQEYAESKKLELLKSEKNHNEAKKES